MNFKTLLAQVNMTIGDFAGNQQKIINAIDEARKQNAHLVVFPELAISGYPPGDLLLLPHFIAKSAQVLESIIKHSKGIAIIVGLPRRNDKGGEKHLFNSAALIDDGMLIGFQDKLLLPTYDVFDELRYFESGHKCAPWTIAGKKVAVTICEDIWQHSQLLEETNYAFDPIVELAKQQVDLVINLSASPYAVGKSHKRLQASKACAKTIQAPLLLCNQVGGNDSLLFDGRSFVMSSKGELLAMAKGFEEDYLLYDMEATLPSIAIAEDEHCEIFEALVMGVRDYFGKSGFSKACIALSGGVDSALVACIAVEALGSHNVSCIGMPSRFSSPGSIDDARLLASNLQVDFNLISIEKPFQSFLDLLEPHFHGKAYDVTEENLQARIRGMIVMAFSNKFGSIVLSTGNKSELAVGYSTLYGDMCGGLAVIGDLTKQQVYAVCRWINRHKDIIPQQILTKAPSAELRPNQKDSDSLPDYAILDAILQAYVERHMNPKDISEKLGFPLALVEDIVRKIHLNEYKRRQNAPTLRISEKAFSIGRHFPIVQKFVL
jgi:NAD+ synthase (glutamine-hydrolysing)